jgi:hypothetical protein
MNYSYSILKEYHNFPKSAFLILQFTYRRSNLILLLTYILHFANTNVFIIKICLDTSIVAKSIMDQREYKFLS